MNIHAVRLEPTKLIQVRCLQERERSDKRARQRSTREPQVTTKKPSEHNEKQIHTALDQRVHTCTQHEQRRAFRCCSLLGKHTQKKDDASVYNINHAPITGDHSK